MMSEMGVNTFIQIYAQTQDVLPPPIEHIYNLLKILMLLSFTKEE